MTKETSPAAASLVHSETSFHIHVDILCYYSTYYRAALKGAFREADRDALDVDASAQTLRLVIQWLYTGGVAITTSTPELVQLYIFADRYDFLALRRQIISIFVPYRTSRFGCARYEQVGQAFDSLHDNSQLRRLIVETYVQHWGPEEDDVEEAADRHKAPGEFLAAVMEGQGRLKRQMKEQKDDGVIVVEECDCCHDACGFHKHESEAERLASKFACPFATFHRICLSY